jgi:hypothetical protein
MSQQKCFNDFVVIQLDLISRYFYLIFHLYIRALVLHENLPMNQTIHCIHILQKKEKKIERERERGGGSSNGTNSRYFMVCIYKNIIAIHPKMIHTQLLDTL